jgi:hypothetical protein
MDEKRGKTYALLVLLFDHILDAILAKAFPG